MSAPLILPRGVVAWAQLAGKLPLYRIASRFELTDVRLFRTADFDCSRSGSLRTVFGTRLRLLFAIESGLRCRGEKRDPVLDLLTSSAFLRTNPTGDSYLPSCPITSSKWSKKYQSIMLDVRPEWQDTRSLSETECQFGRLSFFKSAANRGSLCKLFSRGSTFVAIRPGPR
jgi:hypothetical protein